MWPSCPQLLNPAAVSSNIAWWRREKRDSPRKAIPYGENAQREANIARTEKYIDGHRKKEIDWWPKEHNASLVGRVYWGFACKSATDSQHNDQRTPSAERTFKAFGIKFKSERTRTPFTYDCLKEHRRYRSTIVQYWSPQSGERRY